MKANNGKAMREALEGMCKASQDVFRSFAREIFAGERRLNSLEVAFDKAKASLSEPPRNCDVGTPEEQAERFWGYCNAHSCNKCPARGGWRTVYVDGASCKLIQCGVLWAQMPYEAMESEAAKC